MLKEFKKFILRGSVIDLAVAVVIGAAFGAVINSMVKDLITPLISAIIGEPNFSNLTFTINGATFYYGSFLNALIAFLSIATVIFFFVIQPINKLKELAGIQDKALPKEKECKQCLSKIPDKAKKCKFCASAQ